MADARAIRAWARDNGYDVPARGKLPPDIQLDYYQAHPDDRPAVELLPSPEEAWEDYGEITPDGFGPDSPDAYSAGPELPLRGPESHARTFSAVPADDAEDAGRAQPDSAPAHARREWRKTAHKPREPQPKTRATRVTAGVRSDIDAKIRFGLMVPGQLWKARDPLCGGTFTNQIDDIAEALTDIVVDSPDLVAFFAGPGGAFMKALKLGAALMPVVQVAMAHHVYHNAEQQLDPQQPAYQDYAA